MILGDTPVDEKYHQVYLGFSYTLLPALRDVLRNEVVVLPLCV